MSHIELRHLSAPNMATVGELLGADYLDASRENQLRPDSVVEANHTVAEHVYGERVARLLRARRIAELDNMYRDNLAAVTSDTAELAGLQPGKVGLILIRPEVAELKQEYADLAVSHGLRVVYRKETAIDFAQYWGMYHHGLIHPDSYHDFPTRTLNYVNLPLQLLVVTASQTVRGGLSVSQYIHTFKGEQGNYRPGTLRGDIGFCALRGCLDVLREDSFNSPDSAVALDPIGAYRHLVRGTIESDGAHNAVDVPMLFYAGQIAHVPDDDEVIRDLSILCQPSELADIAEAICSHDK